MEHHPIGYIPPLPKPQLVIIVCPPDHEVSPSIHSSRSRQRLEGDEYMTCRRNRHRVRPYRLHVLRAFAICRTFVDHTRRRSARRSEDSARTSRLTFEQPAHPFCSYGATLGVAEHGVSKPPPLP